ncbi:hypothetical protein [Elizabethkingia anophelis]|uniref:hypothetical protein n=1 Tax=Elizabethkingia anophelis TaxID=1117645 RepID=UPI0032087ED8
MKKSITYLPHINRPDLNFLTESILKRAKQTEMIILFVNYARKDYVVYDEKFEFGKLQFSVSEYDILVATNGISERDTGKALDNIKILYYNRAKAPEHEPPVQFITIDIKKLNKELDKGRHFLCR